MAACRATLHQTVGKRGPVTFPKRRSPLILILSYSHTLILSYLHTLYLYTPTSQSCRTSWARTEAWSTSTKSLSPVCGILSKRCLSVCSLNSRANTGVQSLLSPSPSIRFSGSKIPSWASQSPFLTLRAVPLRDKVRHHYLLCRVVPYPALHISLPDNDDFQNITARLSPSCSMATRGLPAMHWP